MKHGGFYRACAEPDARRMKLINSLVPWAQRKPGRPYLPGDEEIHYSDPWRIADERVGSAGWCCGELRSQLVVEIRILDDNGKNRRFMMD